MCPLLPIRKPSAVANVANVPRFHKGWNSELGMTSPRVDNVSVVSWKSKMGASVAVVSIISPYQNFNSTLCDSLRLKEDKQHA